MSFSKFIKTQVLLEGGNAIQNAQPMTQAEVQELAMYVTRDLHQLGFEYSKIAVIGSAGKKPKTQLSNDLDIALLGSPQEVQDAASKLGLQATTYPFTKAFCAMPHLGTYSFGRIWKGKLVQIDLIQSDDMNFTKWSYHSDETDLAAGLKSAHRNELLAAVAKFASRQVLLRTAEGDELGVESLRYDFNRGLIKCYRDRVGKTKTLKNFTTRTKELVSRSPDEIAVLLFGKHIKGSDLMSFTNVLKLVLSPRFIHIDKIQDIIQRCVEGLSQKKLMIPPALMSVSLHKPSLQVVPLENRLLQQEAIADMTSGQVKQWIIFARAFGKVFDDLEWPEDSKTYFAAQQILISIPNNSAYKAIVVQLNSDASVLLKLTGVLPGDNVMYLIQDNELRSVAGSLNDGLAVHPHKSLLDAAIDCFDHMQEIMDEMNLNEAIEDLSKDQVKTWLGLSRAFGKVFDDLDWPIDTETIHENLHRITIPIPDNLHYNQIMIQMNPHDAIIHFNLHAKNSRFDKTYVLRGTKLHSTSGKLSNGTFSNSYSTFLDASIAAFTEIQNNLTD